MPLLFLQVPPIGIGANDGFTYRADRPARHCRICGASYQPEEARSPDFHSLIELQYKTDYLLKQWGHKHNATHSVKEHVNHIKSGRFLSPQAAMQLIPLGIYPLTDLVFDDEVQAAGLEAPRCPKNDIPY